MKGVTETRHAPGRPMTRWEDIFISWMGPEWFKFVCTKEVYKKQMSSFVYFALKITDTTESIPAIVNDEIKREDTLVDLNPEWAHWTPITQCSKRLEFCW